MKYCEEFAALLDSYVDGELSGEEAARMQAHLETCPGCRRYVDDALAIRAAFPEVEETEVPEGFAEGVMAAVREAEARRSGGRRRVLYWRKVLLPLAACFVVVLVLRAVPGRGGGATPAMDTAAPAAVTDAAASLDLAEAAPSEAEAPQPAVPYSLAAEPAPESGAETPAETDGGEDPAVRIASAPPAVEADAGGNAADTDGAQAVPTSGEEAPAALGIAPAAGGEEKNSTPAEAVAPRIVDGRTQSGRVVRLTAEEAGDLLADLPYTEEDGVRCYQLPHEDFDALLAALAERGIASPEEALPETEVLPEDCDLVYVTEE